MRTTYNYTHSLCPHLSRCLSHAHTRARTTPPHRRPRLLRGVPASQLAAGNALLDDAEARLKQLELAIKTQQPDFAGVRVSDVLKAVARLEVLQAPGL